MQSTVFFFFVHLCPFLFCIRFSFSQMTRADDGGRVTTREIIMACLRRLNGIRNTVTNDQVRNKTCLQQSFFFFFLIFPAVNSLVNKTLNLGALYVGCFHDCSFSYKNFTRMDLKNKSTLQSGHVRLCPRYGYTSKVTR